MIGKIPTLAFAILLAGLVYPAEARNVPYRLPLQPLLDSPQFRDSGSSDMMFLFGNTPSVPGISVISSLVVTRKARIPGKADEIACATAMVAALRELRDHAVRQGGNAVVNVNSAFRGNIFSSATDYECHAGSHSVVITLQASIAKVPR